MFRLKVKFLMSTETEMWHVSWQVFFSGQKVFNLWIKCVCFCWSMKALLWLPCIEACGFDKATEAFPLFMNQLWRNLQKQAIPRLPVLTFLLCCTYCCCRVLKEKGRWLSAAQSCLNSSWGPTPFVRRKNSDFLLVQNPWVSLLAGAITS